MKDEHGPVASASLLVGARLASLAIGLLSIPVLIRSLGGTGFAAWAILLALSAGFALFELGLGMPATVSRFISLEARDGNWLACRRFFAKAWVLMALSFAAGLAVIVPLSRLLAAWMDLPSTPLMTSHEAIVFVFTMVAARAFLQPGMLSMFAAQRFRAVSGFTLAQPALSNIAAMAAAWTSGRLDLTLIAYWSTQLAVTAAAFAVSRRMAAPSFASGAFAGLRDIVHCGVANQMEGLAQFVNFQFDKFVVAAWVGLWGVAPYEVANRAIAALRSIPASGAESFLPLAIMKHQDPEQRWEWYRSSLRLVVHALFVFVLAPVAVSPLFLYAWTGEMGFLGRWVFVALGAGVCASLLAVPAVTMAQAAGWLRLQRHAAALSVLVNIPLSVWLVTRWGLVGGACGTALSMVAASSLFTASVHRRLGRPLAPTLAFIARFWPALAICLVWGALCSWGLDNWLASVDPAFRFARESRVVPAVLSCLAYAGCAGCLFAFEWRRGGLSPAEKSFLRGPLKWARRRDAATG